MSFSDETPFTRSVRFKVRVRHKGRDEIVTVQPGRSRRIGTFDFEEGADGFVEILAGGSKGKVIADAVVFRRVGRKGGTGRMTRGTHPPRAGGGHRRVYRGGGHQNDFQ